MGVHAAGTQHGLVYHFAPLEGTRAPVLIALESRAAAAHVPFQPLQQLIWQIMGGLSYSEMPAQSQQLVDQLIPEFRGRLSEDFVETLQKGIHNKPDWLCKYAPWACKASGEIDTLNQRYERTRQTLLQNADNFEALSRQMVNVIPGMAENAGPSSWSRVNSRVYARLTGGNVYGEMSTLEIRVLTSAGSGNTASRRSGHLQAARYALTGSDIPSEAGSDLADVPLEALIAYPNQNMQGVTGVVGSGPTVQLDTPTINGTSVSVNGVATPTAPGSTITQIAWNWGDGTPAQIGWFPETHSYTAAGTYTISVTATDSNGLTGSARTSAQLLPILPGGGFTPSIRSVTWEPSGPTNWKMMILGSQFGSGSTGFGNSAWLKITDTHASGRSWDAGYTGDWVGVDITTWTDNEIAIDYFGGRYGLSLYQGFDWAFEPGDQVRVEIWNPQTKKAANPFNTEFPSVLTPAEASYLSSNYTCWTVPLSEASGTLGQLSEQFGNQVLNNVALEEAVSMAIEGLFKAVPGIADASALKQAVAGTYTVGTEINGVISDYQSQGMIDSYLQKGWTPNQKFNVCSMTGNSSLSVTNAPNGWTNPIFLVYPIESPEDSNQPSVITITANPNTVAPSGRTTISGVVRDSGGNPIAGTSVTLSASEAGASAPTTSVTTGVDGSYSLPFTAPPTPGIVTITARIVGVPNSPVATAILRVVSKK